MLEIKSGLEIFIHQVQMLGGFKILLNFITNLVVGIERNQNLYSKISHKYNTFRTYFFSR